MGSNLKPSSLSLLYDGMLVKDDIYDANSMRLLVKSGTTLNRRLIEAMKKINDNMDTIYVSADVYAQLKPYEEPIEASAKDVAEEPAEESTVETIVKSIEEVKLDILEDSSGYAEVKQHTVDILSDIASSNTLQKENVDEAASNLSETLKINTTSTIVNLINALSPIGEYLQRHCINVGLLNGLFGKALGLSEERVEELILIGLLHDCGKALISPSILNAPRKLTITEYEVVKMHTVYPYDLLDEFDNDIVDAACGHHEKLNGKGYPYKLKGEEIPFEARITSISDIYDALVSQRSYTKFRSPFSALVTLFSIRDEEVDGELLNVFIDLMLKELLNKHMNMSDGSIGIVRSYDLEDLEFPTIEVNGALVKTNPNYNIVSMRIGDIEDFEKII